MKIYIAKIKFELIDIYETKMWAYDQVKAFSNKEDAEAWGKAHSMPDDVIEIEEVIL